MDIPDTPFELQLAAVIHLLSSSALHGATHQKTEALRAHLRSARNAERLDPQLKKTLQQVLDGWEAVYCHPASTPVSHRLIAATSRQTH